MLVDGLHPPSDAHSETVAQIISLIEASVAPEHAGLNELLQSLANADIVEESLAETNFSFAPILRILNAKLRDAGGIEPQFLPESIMALAGFMESLGKFLARLDDGARVEFAQLTATFLHLFGRAYVHRNQTISESQLAIVNAAHVKMDSLYKEAFRHALSQQDIGILLEFVCRLPGPISVVDPSMLLFMWRNFAKAISSGGMAGALLDQGPLVLDAIKADLERLAVSDACIPHIVPALKCVQVLMRVLLKKIPEKSDSTVAATLGTMALTRSIRNPEVEGCVKNIAGDMRHFFNERPGVVLSVRSLLPQASAEREIFESLVSPAQSTASDVPPSVEMKGETFPLLEGIDGSMRLLPEGLNGTDHVNALVEMASRLRFMAAPAVQWRVHCLLRAAFLSRTSEGLNELVHSRFMDVESSLLSTANLVFLAVFPFSLWRAGDKTEWLGTVLPVLLFGWRLLTSSENQANTDLIFLILDAVANVVSEQPDAVRTENYRSIMLCIGPTLVLLRANDSLSPSGRHCLITSLLRLLRGLLVLRDDKLYEVIESAVKVAGLDVMSSSMEGWKFVGQLPFVKHARDGEKLNRFVVDKFEGLAGRLLTEGPNDVLSKHYCRHVLYQYCKYAHDVGAISKSCLQRESEALALYIRGYPGVWRLGPMNEEAERRIAGWLRGRGQPDNPSILQLSLVPVPSMAAVSALGQRARSLLRGLLERVDEYQQRRNEEALHKLIHKLAQ